MAVAVVVVTLCAAGCGFAEKPVPADNTAALAGQTKFNSICINCHIAAFLAPNADRITNDMGTVNSRMSGITLTDQEVSDLQAYLATQ